MKRIALTLLALVSLILVAIIIGGLVLPSDYRVQRSINIDAHDDKLLPMVLELRHWQRWEPWSEGDSSIITTVQKNSGVGAQQSWTGDEGTGELTFTAVSPKLTQYDMSFDQGQWSSKGELQLKRINNQSTQVTWVMHGEVSTPIIGSYFAAMMGDWVGPMYERGLIKLKAVAEGKPIPAPSQ